MLARLSVLAVLALFVSAMPACTEDGDPKAETLKAACDAHACPSPPPDGIDCQPIVPDSWAPICEQSCRSFLHDTCGIQFSD